MNLLLVYNTYMAKVDLKGKWIVVTGASSGLGMEIARQMAGNHGANLILAARRRDRLEELAEEIKSKAGVSVSVVETDLSSSESLMNLFNRSIESDDLAGVVNCAGMTYFGEATLEHLDNFKRIMDVNLGAVMELTLRYLDYFRKKGSGIIQNVTSMGGFTPLPFQAAYSASKHGIEAFTEAVAEENRGNGVSILAYAPGGINTEMYSSSGLEDKLGKNNPANMSAEKAAKIAVRAFCNRKRLEIPGLMNKITTVISRLIPRSLLIYATGKIYRS